MVTRSRENCRERCEAFSILAQEFNEGFALVTVMVGRQRVNVMMTRWSFVLVKDERVVLEGWKSLWPLAAGLTTSCRAELPRTTPADATYPNGNPQEQCQIPQPHATLVMLRWLETRTALQREVAVLWILR